MFGWTEIRTASNLIIKIQVQYIILSNTHFTYPLRLDTPSSLDSLLNIGVRL